MGVVGRLNQYASMQAAEFDDYSMSENLHLYSENFSNAYWTKANSSIISNATIAPDGTLTADALIENTTPSIGHQVSTSITYVTGKTYTRSCYFKLYPGPITRYVRLQLANASVFGIDCYININLTTGLIINTLGSPSATSITNVGNGWYRASITKTYTGGGITTSPGITIINTSGTALYTDPDGLSGVYIWGAQWEESSAATDYTPTTTTAVTRILSSTTNTNITGLGTYYSSGFDENVGFTTFLPANISAPYDPVYDEFGGTLFGAGQGRYMRQYTDKSVIVYNEIDEITDLFGRGIVRDGLVLDLDAGISASYPGSGTTWTDLSVYSNTGTLTNGPTYSSSNGGSIVFDGTNDYVTINQTLSTPFTITGFVRYTDQAKTLNMYMNTTPHTVLGISLNRLGGGQLYVYIGNGSGWFATPAIISSSNMLVNTWYQVTFTSTGSGSTLYLNGNSVGTSIYSPSGWGSTYYLGAGFTGSFIEHLKGNISTTQIYNRALTASEITQNYNALKHRFGL